MNSNLFMFLWMIYDACCKEGRTGEIQCDTTEYFNSNIYDITETTSRHYYQFDITVWLRTGEWTQDFIVQIYRTFAILPNKHYFLSALVLCFKKNPITDWFHVQKWLGVDDIELLRPFPSAKKCCKAHLLILERNEWLEMTWFWH